WSGGRTRRGDMRGRLGAVAGEDSKVLDHLGRRRELLDLVLVGHVPDLDLDDAAAPDGEQEDPAPTLPLLVPHPVPARNESDLVEVEVVLDVVPGRAHHAAEIHEPPKPFAVGLISTKAYLGPGFVRTHHG